MATSSESKCDVLIVGAGPAGLMMATWMARCGINARVVDKRGTKIYAGQADGLQIRSLEIFDSFGFADRAMKEANHMVEVCTHLGRNHYASHSRYVRNTIPNPL
jgi:2-polyprenyl-6-methoxyphenol hydroxylase-like FAD-dependent oxidoreductase